MSRSDIKPNQPLKAKQRALLAAFQRLQPVTIRRVALAIHGDDDPLHIRMVHNQVPALQSRGLITPAGVAEVAPDVRGIRPLLWRACA
jgi:hypothetical protein